MMPRGQALEKGCKGLSHFMAWPLDKEERNLIHNARLDRQLRIEGWNQHALDKAKIAVVGDNDLLASLFVLSASALGINNLVLIAPDVDRLLVEIAEKINPLFTLTHIKGYYTHPITDDFFKGCSPIVDLSHYGLANKLLLEKGYREMIPVVRGFCCEQDNMQGLKVFTYIRGREWSELDQIVCPGNLPGDHFDDGVLDTIVAGMVLEETKNILMLQRVSDALICYKRRAGAYTSRSKILIIGSGALGTFVGLGLAYSGFKDCTFMDPDVIELTNLNRQILLYDALGQSKAKTLSDRLNEFFGMNSTAKVEYFGSDTDISSYDVVFDCVDNFETRIALSEKCKVQGKVLISGGTSADAGQVVVYDPKKNGVTPAELLGLYQIVSSRTGGIPLRKRDSCVYRPDPSVIMSNQIIAGFMVDSYRMLLNGQETRNIFYDSTSRGRI
jgi:molybdopterin/thiamine biosynthesis adenylyltransferase